MIFADVKNHVKQQDRKELFRRSNCKTWSTM